MRTIKMKSGESFSGSSDRFSDKGNVIEYKHTFGTIERLYVENISSDTEDKNAGIKGAAGLAGIGLLFGLPF